mmetsp:Transcript_34351/g.67578  ORF Transcript_34351/g.67578 Transcript_34351/m.67578 type:complete len:246 (-) Transcript_34351:396-1133(-)
MHSFQRTMLLGLKLLHSFAIILATIYLFFVRFMGVPNFSSVVILVAVLPIIIISCIIIEYLRKLWCPDDNTPPQTPKEKRREIENRLITRKFVSTGTMENLKLAHSSKDSNQQPLSSDIEICSIQKRISSHQDLENLEIGQHKILVCDPGEHLSEKETPDKSLACLSFAQSSISQGIIIDNHYCNIESCDIYLCNYEVGEEICSSHNPECRHIFHKDCIIDWLLTRSSCPHCRRSYLCDNKKVEI